MTIRYEKSSPFRHTRSNLFNDVIKAWLFTAPVSGEAKDIADLNTSMNQVHM